jgi:hypothetical protein
MPSSRAVERREVVAVERRDGDHDEERAGSQLDADHDALAAALSRTPTISSR